MLLLLVPVLTVVVGGVRGPGRFCWLGGGLQLELHRKKETVLFLGPRKDRIRIRIGAGSVTFGLIEQDCKFYSQKKFSYYFPPVDGKHLLIL